MLCENFISISLAVWPTALWLSESVSESIRTKRFIYIDNQQAASEATHNTQIGHRNRHCHNLQIDESTKSLILYKQQGKQVLVATRTTDARQGTTEQIKESNHQTKKQKH